ncbi:MAG: hypothetical protein LBB08_02700 [Rickettsiales bacterium]|jgi:hypothetical protein|nr:hypothetical protein [Rickettsiales bacterium]
MALKMTIKRTQGKLDNLLRHPKMTKQLVESINKLMRVPETDKFDGKMIQALGNPVYMAETSKKLNEILTQSKPQIMLLSGGPSRAYSKFGPEYIGALLMDSVGHVMACRHDMDDCFADASRQFAEMVGMTMQFAMDFSALLSRSMRRELRFTAESTRIFRQIGPSLSSVNPQRQPIVITETSSRNTYENFLFPQIDGLYNVFLNPNLVIVSSRESALRAKLTAETVLLGQAASIEVAPFKSPLAWHDGCWEKSPLGIRFMWAEVQRLIKHGDWAFGDPGVGSRIRMPDDKQADLANVIAIAASDSKRKIHSLVASGRSR